MTGLDPVIHDFLRPQVVDTRVKPAHDYKWGASEKLALSLNAAKSRNVPLFVGMRTGW